MVPATPERDARDFFRRVVRDQHFKESKTEHFIPGVTYIPPSGKVIGPREKELMAEAVMDGWLTTGRFAKQFEEGFAKFVGRRHAVLCNSGSSANLLALSALTSSRCKEPLMPGDEVLTTAAAFPTTVNPIVQNLLTPVFVDITLPTYNIKVSDLGVGSRTRAIMTAHTLGNPFSEAVHQFAHEHDLSLIEDCCDALGSECTHEREGLLSTYSFYPAHQMTMGEGGCVATDDASMKMVVESFRDWGRSCWCDPGKDNTCGKRFSWQLGDLPEGYDHKYCYDNIGYNLKATDVQAACGVAQLEKLPSFIERRRHNFKRLYDGLKDLETFFILPEATPGTNPAWFGFPLSIRPWGTWANRSDVVRYLEDHRIGTRPIFAGNLLKQPAYRTVPNRVVGSLVNTDFVMAYSFWVGVWPGITDQMIDYMIEAFHLMKKDMVP